jgi:hypothetical protein
MAACQREKTRLPLASRFDLSSFMEFIRTNSNFGGINLIEVYPFGYQAN